MGLYTGTLVALMTPITIQMVKLKHLSPAHGLEVFFCGIGFTIGPPVAGMFIGPPVAGMFMGIGRKVVSIEVGIGFTVVPLIAGTCMFIGIGRKLIAIKFVILYISYGQ